MLADDYYLFSLLKQKSGNQDVFLIKSIVPINQLFEIQLDVFLEASLKFIYFSKKKNELIIHLLFFNNERSISKLPKTKVYKLEDTKKFLSFLKKQLNNISYDLVLL